MCKAGQGVVKQFTEAFAAMAGQNPSAFPWPVDLPAAGAQQQSYVEQIQLFWTSVLGWQTGGGQVDQKGDRRFKGADWQIPGYDLLKQSYLSGAKLLNDLVDTAAVDDRTRMHLRFFARQYIDAMSPANFAATNPEAIRLAIETKGESLAAGLRNLIDDMQRGRISMTDESAFEVGGNLAITPGAVVFENELMQLIQYAPMTDSVGAVSLLIVPPAINKFYVLDL